MKLMLASRIVVDRVQTTVQHRSKGVYHGLPEAD